MDVQQPADAPAQEHSPHACTIIHASRLFSVAPTGMEEEQSGSGAISALKTAILLSKAEALLPSKVQHNICMNMLLTMKRH